MNKKIEYRVYYDKDGKILDYTTQKKRGRFIVITAQQYLESRFDCLVIDKKLVYNNKKKQISKFELSDDGIKCDQYDINIILDQNVTSDYNMWKLKVYEL